MDEMQHGEHAIDVVILPQGAKRKDVEGMVKTLDELTQQRLAMQDDPVHPQHYAHLNAIGMSALHVTEAWGNDYHIGQALKYMQRKGLKEGESEVVELKKAIWYLQRKVYLLDPSEPNPMKDDGADKNAS